MLCRFVFVVISLCFVINACGCSVLIMRHDREKQQKRSQVDVGWSKDEVDKYFGRPSHSVIHEDNSRTCIYEFRYNSPYETKDTEVIENLTLGVDILSLGIWEIIMTPVTLVMKGVEHATYSSKCRVWATYGPDNRVLFIKRVSLYPPKASMGKGSTAGDVVETRENLPGEIRPASEEDLLRRTQEPGQHDKESQK